MNRDEVARLADVLAAAADARETVYESWYMWIRQRVADAVGDAADINAVLPMDPDVSGEDDRWLRSGQIILRGGAAYLRGVVKSGAGVSPKLLAATDVLGQAQSLLDDDDVHVAAPIVLAGAALEEALRGQVEARGLDILGHGSITTYAMALRRASVLTEPDRALAEVVAKVRNDAAHGRFTDLHRDQAQLAVSQVAFLLSKLSDELDGGQD